MCTVAAVLLLLPLPAYLPLYRPLSLSLAVDDAATAPMDGGEHAQGQNIDF